MSQVANQWVEVNGGQWSPSAEVLADVKNTIIPSIIKNQKDYGRKLTLRNSYTFQYQGQIQNEIKVIRVNAFCSNISNSKISEQWIQVKDGGSCYMGGVYEVKSQKFISVFVNGEA